MTLDHYRDLCAQRGADTVFEDRKMNLFVIEEDGTESDHKVTLEGGTYLMKEGE